MGRSRPHGYADRDRPTRADLLECAARAIDLIAQVGRDEGWHGVEEVFMPGLER